MEVIVISSSTKFNSEIPQIIELFEKGVMTFHLRKTKFSTKKLKEYLDKIPEKYHPRIVIHSHHKLAFRYNLKGIHLTKRHRKNKLKCYLKCLWFRLRRPKNTISRSFHQLETLTSNRYKFDYVFINPIFSKMDETKNSFDVSYTYLSDVIKNSKCPVYASGNITTTNFQLLQPTGLKGFAISKLLHETSTNPVALYTQISEEVGSW